MSYVRDPKVSVQQQAPPEIREVPQAGTISTYTPGATYSRYATKRVPARTRLEKAGFSLIVIAALALLFVLAGVILPPLFSGLIAGTFTAGFVGMLTLLNLPR